MNIHNKITDLIGNTPILKLNGASELTQSNIFAKCEFLNPMSSIKDRIANAMINDALNKNIINEDTKIIEPTSGNTGIGLAMVCASKGLDLTLTMPESMSKERRQILLALGAKPILTPSSKGMNGAIQEAQKLADETKNSFLPQQFKNMSNPQIHRDTTALEILSDTDGKIDIVVLGVGTGGSITGIAEVLKKHNKNLKVIAVEPNDSPVLSKGEFGPHKIQGIGAGFVPDTLNKNIIDEIITVSNEDAFATSKNLARTEGILVGISSGANVWAATKVAQKEENKGKNIFTILYDTGERYLSTSLFD